MPRMNKLSEDLNSSPSAFYWLKAFNAAATRMALLALIVGAVE